MWRFRSSVCDLHLLLRHIEIFMKGRMMRDNRMNLECTDRLTDSDETLVTDVRSGLTPSQFVEKKLMLLLDDASPLLVSHVQSFRMSRTTCGTT